MTPSVGEQRLSPMTRPNVVCDVNVMQAGDPAPTRRAQVWTEVLRSCVSKKPAFTRSHYDQPVGIIEQLCIRPHRRRLVNGSAHTLQKRPQLAPVGPLSSSRTYLHGLSVACDGQSPAGTTELLQRSPDVCAGKGTVLRTPKGQSLRPASQLMRHNGCATLASPTAPPAANEEHQADAITITELIPGCVGTPRRRDRSFQFRHRRYVLELR